jgi:hypothetical protein
MELSCNKCRHLTVESTKLGTVLFTCDLLKSYNNKGIIHESITSEFWGDGISCLCPLKNDKNVDS